MFCWTVRCFIPAGQCDNVILEEPDPVLEPLGGQMVLNCRVSMEYRTSWRVDGSRLTTESQAFINSLHIDGIISESSSAENREPPLIVSRTVENSGTTFQCIAIEVEDAAAMVCDGRVVLLLFYGKGYRKLCIKLIMSSDESGPPLAPKNLTATANGLGSLQISWSLDNADNVSVDYVVTATDVATPSETIIKGTSQLNSVISFSDNISCNNYSIQVVANNSAGQGPPSDVIIRSVPSLPEISAVEESLQHTLRRTSNGITLDVILKV